MLTPELITDIIVLAAIVVPITQATKKWLRADGMTALIISAVVSILFALWKTLSVQPYDWGRFIILVIGVFLEANGIYHFGSYAVGKMVKQKGISV
ncbi:MAG: hypothetical protein FVQ80_18035 [Planctomycetes bacterium]|nr:hypothetical protein [Planctomycetota bacterium]